MAIIETKARIAAKCIHFKSETVVIIDKSSKNIFSVGYKTPTYRCTAAIIRRGWGGASPHGLPVGGKVARTAGTR